MVARLLLTLIQGHLIIDSTNVSSFLALAFLSKKFQGQPTSLFYHD